MPETTAQLAIPGSEQAENQQLTPMRLIAIAMQDERFDPEKLKALFELQKDWEANEARKAFVKAMNLFKQNPPEIVKNKSVAFKEVRYKYATLDNVCDQVTERLSAYGISHRWDVYQNADAAKNFMSVKVTCILTHELGHSESISIEGPPDTSGSKNAIQAIASTIHYLERYTLLAATGLAEENADDDGHGGASGEKLKDLDERLHWIKDANNLEDMRKQYEDAWHAAHEIGDTDAETKIVAARDARKKELTRASR